MGASFGLGLCTGAGPRSLVTLAPRDPLQGAGNDPTEAPLRSLGLAPPVAGLVAAVPEGLLFTLGLTWLKSGYWKL